MKQIPHSSATSAYDLSDTEKRDIIRLVEKN
jgi:hypothetical protein